MSPMVNEDKILMQKKKKEKENHIPRTINSTNFHHLQYSSYNDTPNMKAKY